MNRIGVLTSGGDAPGMNTAIRAVVRSADARGAETWAFEDGYTGLIEGRGRVISPRDVGDILHRGGTVLRTARCPEMRTPSGLAAALSSLEESAVEGLIVIGGDGSMRGAHALAGEGVAVVGIPASIDNDIWGTKMSLGVDSALNTIMEAIDKLRDTASSHKRAFLIETMGAGSGFLAGMAGVICGAELVVTPDTDVTVEEIGRIVARAHQRGKHHCFVIVAEGADLDVEGIAGHLRSSGIGFESRVTKLGHVQRGGSPSAFDRMLASRMGIEATNALLDGHSDVMTGLDGWNVALADLGEACSRVKRAGMEYVTMASLLSR